MSKSAPSGILGVDMMSDTLDFFKNMWENAPGMNLPGMKHIPGMVMPTLSIDEIDKQIKDLQAVESWLSLNLNMLHTTIQALEVQKATLSTLQTMGETITAAMQPMSPAAEERPAFQSPFVSSAASQASAAQAHRHAAEEKSAAQEKSVAGKKAAAEKTEASPIQPALDATAAMADAMQPLANPAAWWGMLQDQFKQAVDTAAAMTPDMSAVSAAVSAAPKKTAKKTAAKTPAAASTDHAAASPRRRKSPSKK